MLLDKVSIKFTHRRQNGILFKFGIKVKNFHFCHFKVESYTIKGEIRSFWAYGKLVRNTILASVGQFYRNFGY